jgi:hypothetical protein
MKSQLDKQKFASLTDEQMNEINGGGWVYTVTGYNRSPDSQTINTFYSRQRTFLGFNVGEPEIVPDPVVDGSYYDAYNKYYQIP